jgi:hypothetical protein
MSDTTSYTPERIRADCDLIVQWPNDRQYNGEEFRAALFRLLSLAERVASSPTILCDVWHGPSFDFLTLNAEESAAVAARKGQTVALVVL